MIIEDGMPLWATCFALISIVFALFAVGGLAIFATARVSGWLAETIATAAPSSLKEGDGGEYRLRTRSRRRRGRAVEMSKTRYRLSVYGVQSSMALVTLVAGIFSIQAVLSVVSYMVDMRYSFAEQVATAPTERAIQFCKWSVLDYSVVPGHKESQDIVARMLAEEADSRIELPWESWIPRDRFVSAIILEDGEALFLSRNEIGVWGYVDRNGEPSSTYDWTRSIPLPDGSTVSATEFAEDSCSSAEWAGSSGYIFKTGTT